MTNANVAGTIDISEGTILPGLDLSSSTVGNELRIGGGNQPPKMEKWRNFEANKNTREGRW